VPADEFAESGPDAHARVEGAIRILEDHLDAAPVVQRPSSAELLALEEDRS